jgi:hypothetical protein
MEVDECNWMINDGCDYTPVKVSCWNGMLCLGETELGEGSWPALQFLFGCEGGVVSCPNNTCLTFGSWCEGGVHGDGGQ